MTNIEYYGFSSNTLSGTPIMESMSPNAPTGMKDDISGTNLYKLNDAYNKVKLDTKDVRVNDDTVVDPYGYGYVPSLNGARVKDAVDIQSQESNIFAIGVVTGVSLIVFGVLLFSSPTAPTTK